MFCGDVLAVGTVVLDECAQPPNPVADAKRRAGTGERVDHSLTFQRAQLYAAFDQLLMELCWMPSATLPGVAGDPREIEHVAGNTTARVRSSVPVLLSPGWNADSVGIER